MASRGTYDTVKQAIQDLIAPELERIKGQLSGLDARIGALDTKLEAKTVALADKLGALDTKLEAKTGALADKIGALDTKVEAVRSELRGLEKRLDETLSIRERLAAVEAALRTTQHP